MRLLSLPEHSRRHYPPVGPALARALDATGLVTPSLGLSGRLCLRSRSVVGVARVAADGAELEVRVRPKVPVARLLWLLGHARDPSGWRDEPAGLAAERDLVPAVAVAFAATAERALAPGVLRGYRTVDDTLPLLRGRLREADQLRGRLGLAPPLEVRFDDYTPDIAENRILVSALRRLHRLPGVPPVTRHRLRRLDGVLADVPPLTAGLPPPPTPTDRLTTRYQPALRLARLILAGSGLEQPPGPLAGVSFAFDLNRVFEDWLTAALREEVRASHGGRITGQHSRHLDEDRRMLIRPDITWWEGRRCRAVVDAKYKDLRHGTPPPGDVYQMLAYCTSLGLPEGHLVYGSPAAQPPAYRLRGSGVRITVHTVDLSAPLDLLRARIARLAAAVTQAPPAGGRR